MIPYLLSDILSYLLETTPHLKIFNDFSYGIIFISHGSTLFIYFRFNKLFRSVLIEYFKIFKIKSCY
jgi:hypothetical protein